MTTPPGISAQDAVVIGIEILAPPERVFAALTDQPQLFAWWGSEPSVELDLFEMDARPGGLWRFTCRPVSEGARHGAVAQQLERNSPVQEFIAHGEVLAYDPPRLLVWSWYSNWHEHPGQPTTVRWELTPTANGSYVQVTHSGLTNEPIARADYGNGWKGVVQLLSAYLDTQ